MRFFIVRRRKVEVALRWLIENNPLYRDVELCEETLFSLPADGIPSEVYDSITFCDKVVEDMMGRSRYDQEDDEEPDEGNRNFRNPLFLSRRFESLSTQMNQESHC